MTGSYNLAGCTALIEFIMMASQMTANYNDFIDQLCFLPFKVTMQGYIHIHTHTYTQLYMTVSLFYM